MILAAVIGVALGLATITAMRATGMLAERSGIAVLVCAVAAFYPVFAVAADTASAQIALHIVIFLAFGAAAAFGYRRGMSVLAACLIAHGLFDALTLWAGHPGPIWWPAFCAGYDIAAGALLLSFTRTTRAAA